jgi:deoxyribodipyrimidine photo-lyase
MLVMNKALCWIRRDLRAHDHAALSHALKENDAVDVVFVFDPTILDKLTDKRDLRVSFIMESLQDLEHTLNKYGGSLHVVYGDPVQEIPRLAQNVRAVYTNTDYEPSAKKRDAQVAALLKKNGVAFHSYKDAVIFEKTEVLNGSGAIYKVFTPYKNKWLEKLAEQDNVVPQFDCDLKKIRQWTNPHSVLTTDWHKKIGFIHAPPVLTGGTTEALKRLKSFEKHMSQYQETRDFPSLDGTSNLSPYIRHGCLSIRDMVRAALKTSDAGSQVWLSELVWRDFYQMILETHPYVEKESFKRDYDKIKWRGQKEWFEAWCEGRTGYPLVDAAMRCLNQTGLMHNRLRMVVASFLCKTLLIDWRQGERYFATHLLDYDMAANNGGWQWSSSTGCDAQPYFRIFNPYNQSEKFDPDGEFIRAWVPELGDVPKGEIHCPSPMMAPDYPRPIVVYEKMRAEALEMYAVVKTS